MATITFDLLEILDAIDRRGSFALAAEELGKVPSSLSYTIQKYEQALNLSLFVRSGRRSVFTPAAKHLLEQGRTLLEAEQRLRTEVTNLATGWEPFIKIAIDSLLPTDQVMTIIGKFVEQHPQIEIDVCEEVLGGAWEALIEDRVQLVVGAPSPKPAAQGIRAESMGTLERVFAVKKGHPLTRLEQPLSQSNIAPYCLVVAHDSTQSGIPWTKRLLSEGKRFYVQNVEQKIAAQRAGIGVGFLPRHQVQSLLDCGEMIALTIEDISTEDELFLAWKTANRGKGLQKLAAMLMAEPFSF